MFISTFVVSVVVLLLHDVPVLTPSRNDAEIFMFATFIRVLTPSMKTFEGILKF